MLRSFMLSSESHRTFRKLWFLLFSTLITLVVIDRLAGYFVRFITNEPPSILRLENVMGIEKLWDYSASGFEPVVFTGSSQTYNGIYPATFNSQIKDTVGENVQSVNLSVWGAVATIQRSLIENLIIPNHPKAILYGIEMRAMLPTSQDENSVWVSDFRNKPLGYAVSQQSSIERDILLWLLQNSNLVRYRDNLRDWLTGTRAVQKNLAAAFINDVGYAPSNIAFSTDETVIKTQFTPFSATPETQQILVDIMISCKQNHIPCILVNMPLHKLAYQFISQQEENLYLDLLKKSGLPIWDFNNDDCRTILGDGSFLNLNHLNSNGGEMLSRMIADMYAQTFFDKPISGNAKCAILSP